MISWIVSKINNRFFKHSIVISVYDGRGNGFGVIENTLLKWRWKVLSFNKEKNWMTVQSLGAPSDCQSVFRVSLVWFFRNIRRKGYYVVLKDENENFIKSFGREAYCYSEI